MENPLRESKLKAHLYFGVRAGMIYMPCSIEGPPIVSVAESSHRELKEITREPPPSKAPPITPPIFMDCPDGKTGGAPFMRGHSQLCDHTFDTVHLFFFCFVLPGG